MKTFAVLVLASVATLASAGLEEHMMHKMDKYNLYSSCFGPEAVAQYYVGIIQACKVCSQQEAPEVDSPQDIANLLPNPLVAARRRRRQAGDFGLTAEDIEGLKAGAQEHVGEMIMKISNMTCVLRALQWLDDEGQINMDHFTYDSVKELIKDSVAGQDDDFVQALAKGYADCGEISKNWPQSTFEGNPLKEAFGKQHVFLMCMFKLEERMCYKFEVYTFMKALWGFDPEVTDLGLPHGNKFEASVNAWKVWIETVPEEMNFIQDLIWNRHNGGDM